VTVQLLPSFTRSLWTYDHMEPLDTAPNYVRSRDATRWHRARSGHQFPDGRLSYTYWCGVNSGNLGVEEIPQGDLLCATCEGRFRAQLDQDGNRWVFTPQASLPPTSCPASGKAIVPESWRGGEFPCLVCGEPVKARAAYRYFAGVKVTRHKAGPNLMDPCRYHGWQYLTLNGDQVVCYCTLRPVAS
jgi:hypothetical protein